MQGKILDYNSVTQQGLIRGSDEQRYEFQQSDVQSQGTIKAGAEVDFEVGEDGKPNSIYIIAGSGPGVMESVSSSEGMNQIMVYISDSMKDGIKNKIALGLCGVTFISFFLPVASFMFKSFTIIGHPLGILLMLILLATTALFFTGASRMGVRIAMGVYALVSAYGLIELFGDAGADVIEILNYGFYVWTFSSFILILIAMVGDYDERDKP